MAVTTKKTFNAVGSGGQSSTTVFTPVSIELNNQDDLDVYVTLSGGTRVLQYRQSTGGTTDSNHPQVNDTTGLYFPAQNTGVTLYNYTLSTDNNTITFNSALPSGAVVSIERRTRDSSSDYTNFAGGSTIRHTDINKAFDESNFTAQEARNKAFEIEGKIFGTEATSTSFIDTNEIVNDAVTADKIADDQINSEHYVDGSIDTAHIGDNQITTAKIAADAITNAKIADNSIDSEHYVDGSIDTAHLADNSVTGAKLAAGTIGTTDIADSTITTAKIADDSVTVNKLASNSVNTGKIVDGNITTAKLAADAVTSGKLADNAVVNANLTSDCVTSDNLADNSVTTVQITDANITSAKIAASAVTTNQLGDDAVTAAKLASNSVVSASIVDGSIVTGDIADDAITSAKIAANAVTTTEIADAELTTLAGMQAGTASILAGGTALTATLTEINSVCDGMGVQSTITNDDTKYPTSGAVVDYVAAQIAPIGGLEVIANDASFPNTQPQAGVVISIADAGGLVVNGSGTSTTGRTVGGSTVTINNINSSYNSSTVTNGVGFLVSSTGSGQIYNFHKSVIRDQDILSISTDINDFANRYRVHNGEPSSNNDDGDLVFDTNANKMKVYDATASAWQEITSTGDFKYLFLCPAGGTGAPTLNGSIATYDLRESSNSGAAASVNSAAQLIVSINGVIQKANTGTSAPAEGFALVDANTIVFGANLASGDSVFIVQIGSAVSIPTPGDNTVATAKIQNLAVTGDKVATNLDLADNKKIRFGTGNDLEIYHNGSHSYIKDTGTGNLNLAGSTVDIINAADSEFLARFKQDDSVELYYDNVKTFATTTNGAIVYGAEGAGAQLYLYADEGDDNADKWRFSTGNDGDVYFQNYADGAWETSTLWKHGGAVELYHDNFKSFETWSNGIYVYGPEGGGGIIRLYGDEGDDNADKWDLNANTNGTLLVRNYASGSWENNIIATGNGNVELYYDGTKKFETTSSGGTLTGYLSFPDNGGIKCGASADLHVYHDGSNSYISELGTGDLILNSNGNNIFLKPTGNETGVKIIADGAVELYHNGEQQCETKANGLEIKTGGDTDSELTVTGPEGRAAIINMQADEGDDNGDIWRFVVSTSNDFYLQNYGSGSYETNIKANNNGNVELYYDGAKKFETDPNGVLQGDNSWHYWGDSDDLYIGHNGTHSFIVNTTGQLQIKGDHIELLGNSAAEYLIRALKDGATELYYDNAKKFETYANGCIMTDGVKLAFGNSEDLQISHDDNALIKNGTGALYIRSNSTYFQNATGSETHMQLINDGAIELYHNNAKVFETESYGATVKRPSGGATVLDVVGPEGENAEINLFADDGDDNPDKWKFRAQADGNFELASYADGSWKQCFHVTNTADNGVYPILQAPQGGFKFDIDVGNPNSTQWSYYNGDGHIHRTDGQAYVTADDYFRVRLSGNAQNKRFEFRTDTGNAGAQNDWQDDQFDFAEMFEWSDGNPDNEDRIGNTVAVDGLTGKIKIAESGDTVIGVVSGTAAFTANCASMQWQGAYLRDEWGRLELELIKDENGNQLYNDPDNGNVRPKVALKPNPDWDETKSYHRREDRKEWDKIGIIGQCYVRKTAVIPSSWIKLKEVDSIKDFYLIK